jgi:hypothetical protein
MKSLAKVSSLASVTTMLVAASVLGFSSSLTVPSAVASPTTTTTTTETTMNATTATPLTPIVPTTIEFEEEPFAESRITPVSENVINETQQVELVFEGSTTITTLPNTTETITTRDIGEGILTFIPGGGVLHGQLQLTTEDGSESAIALFTEHFTTESTTAISLVQFITNSTGLLAPLHNMIAVTLDQEQPDGSVIVRYFEWEESAASGRGEVAEGEEEGDEEGEEDDEEEEEA